MNSIERREARHRGRCRFLSLVATIAVVMIVSTLLAVIAVSLANGLGGFNPIEDSGPTAEQTKQEVKRVKRQLRDKAQRDTALRGGGTQAQRDEALSDETQPPDTEDTPTDEPNRDFLWKVHDNHVNNCISSKAGKYDRYYYNGYRIRGEAEARTYCEDKYAHEKP
jgi:hypothetical protein